MFTSRVASKLVVNSVAKRLVPAVSSTSIRHFQQGSAEKMLIQVGMRQASTQAPAAPKVTGATKSAHDMFCFHCEQTQNGTGCTTVGICGKTPEVAAMQDLLVHKLKEMSTYIHSARQAGATAEEITPYSIFLISSLYATLTNVNFSMDRFVDLMQECSERIVGARALYTKVCEKNGTTPITFAFPQPFEELSTGEVKGKFSAEDMVKMGKDLAVDARIARLGQPGNLQELLTYGLKGLSAYSKEALNLKSSDDKVFDWMHESMAFLSMASPAPTAHNPLEVGDVLNMCLECGGQNVRVMELLDKGHTNMWGAPSPAQVRTNPIPGKCILVSGHDTGDLVEILKLTEGKGINVYTHGELLPAHGYPEIRKYKHLAGNYGGAWQLQKFEFSKFPGAILMTTNCIIEPREQYKKRIFTTGPVGYDGVTHVARKDFNKVVEAALAEPGFPETHAKDAPTYTMTGFGHDALLNTFGPVLINAIKQGDLKRLWLIGGCDGNESERSYYTKLATSVPKDHAVLTLGCAKYRFNKLDFGTIPTQFNGETVQIPRLVDIGQCNDAYSAVVVASKLAEVFGTNDINKLPLNLAIAWLEQKAVVIFLTLLKLGLKNVRVGPNLPAFIDAATLDVLVNQFHVKPINHKDVLADMEAMIGGN